MFYKIVLFFSKIYTHFFLSGFYKIGNNTIIKPMLNSMNRDKISIGNNVNIGSFCWISVSTAYGEGEVTSKNKVRLKIGNNVDIGNNAFIVANNDIQIGNNVIMGPYVYMSDHIHQYENVDRNLCDQPLSQGGHIKIGDNVFIGIKACILPNITIGERAVIGAATVVTKDVPPYCVVVGNPAKVIKKYNFELKKWVKIEHFDNGK